MFVQTKAGNIVYPMILHLFATNIFIYHLKVKKKMCVFFLSHFCHESYCTNNIIIETDDQNHSKFATQFTYYFRLKACIWSTYNQFYYKKHKYCTVLPSNNCQIHQK